MLPVLLGALLAHTAATSGEPVPRAELWHTLEPGQHAVGFKVVWGQDWSRTWLPAATPNMSPAPRPIRIAIWYPAAPQSQAAQLRYRDYVHIPTPPNKTLSELEAALEAYDLGTDHRSIKGLFKSQELVERLLDTRCAALREPAPAAGRFPLVLYSLGQNDYTQENIVLLEYLASHGFVVASVPHLGTSPRRFHLLIDDPLSYEAQVRDLEYALQALHAEPYVDEQRIAAMGHSMGGVYALLVAMRLGNLRGVIGLDPSFVSKPAPFFYKYWTAPGFDRARLRAPLLVLHKHEGGVDTTVLDQLSLSDRHVVEFARLTHADFNSYPLVTAQAPAAEIAEYDLKRRTQTEAVLGHELVCRYVLSFLQSCLAGAAEWKPPADITAAVTAGFAQYSIRPGLRVPTEEEFFGLIERQGLEHALKRFQAEQTAHPQATLLREQVMNRIGYELLWSDQAALAVSVFQLNARAHPQSENAFDSLGEACQAAGNRSSARQAYQRILEINPSNAAAKKHLDELKR